MNKTELVAAIAERTPFKEAVAAAKRRKPAK